MLVIISLYQVMELRDERQSPSFFGELIDFLKFLATSDRLKNVDSFSSRLQERALHVRCSSAAIMNELAQLNILLKDFSSDPHR